VAADLPGRRNYSEILKDFSERPDIILTSESSKTTAIIELTVPFECNMSDRHEFKMAKYEGLCRELHRRGYKTHLHAVEVGARGFCGSSAYSLLKWLGLPSQRRVKYLRQMAETAEAASYWIWLKRNDKGWNK